MLSFSDFAIISVPGSSAVENVGYRHILQEV